MMASVLFGDTVLCLLSVCKCCRKPLSNYEQIKFTNVVVCLAKIKLDIKLDSEPMILLCIEEAKLS